MGINGSPSYSSFSFPKLNGSPSRPMMNHIGGTATPIDTVLDRFGRTGTIFPSSSINPSVGGIGTTSNHRMLPSIVPPFGRANSLGRSLPPIPSKPPTLVRRRTLEDDEDKRTDWI